MNLSAPCVSNIIAGSPDAESISKLPVNVAPLKEANVDDNAVPSNVIASASNVPSINTSLNCNELVPKSISLFVIGTIAPSCILNCCTDDDDTFT